MEYDDEAGIACPSCKNRVGYSHGTEESWHWVRDAGVSFDNRGFNRCRPCPWVSCRYHLYLDVKAVGKQKKHGSIKIFFPDKDPTELKHTCALDLADEKVEGMTLAETADTMNVSRERARQIEEVAKNKLRALTLGLGFVTQELASERTKHTKG